MFKLIVDNFCEVKEFTKPWESEIFWNFAEHKIVPGAVYLISRQQFTDNIEQIRELARAGTILPILGNPAEGSDTMFRQIQSLDILDLVQQNKILIITGGDLPSHIPALFYENFLPKILDYSENIAAIYQYAAEQNSARPYKFLFLNGRGRKHRQYLIIKLSGLLDQAIWTNLDASIGPIKLLESKYEFDFYRNPQNLPDIGFIKYKLFNQQWGEIYLNAASYLDTYFSLVTETVFEYPYSFRTEKIWKPVAIGHPFIVASNAGYYRDLRNLGFRTFNRLIDESFDTIENNNDRLERIVQVIEDLCRQDLAKFSQECYDVCKYNQEHLNEMRITVRQKFPDQFYQFVNQHIK